LPEATAIECIGVRKTYATATGSVEAVHGLDAVFAPGTLNALVGPSGCGKSTLLRLVAGIDGVDAGSIRVGSTEVERLRGAALRSYRRETATYVAQHAAANLVPHLSLRHHFVDRSDLRLLEPLGLGARLDSRASQLSGGEQARAALAVAVARRTPALLLDEPTAELDRDTATHVLEVLGAAAQAGHTVVIATHDHDVMAIAGSIHAMGGHVPLPDHAVQTAEPGTRGPVLSVNGLTKRYGSTHAVEDVTFGLAQGEVGVLLGRSGSGKSTLLMILGGWLQPDAGRHSVASLAWHDVGYLPQRFGLLPELSIAENVGLPTRVAGSEGDARIADVLRRLGLAELATRLPAETSVGQQQRAALARALIQSPGLLLADEPTSHQDSRSAGLAWEAILTSRAEGTACLIATHDESAAAYADRVWEIADGRIAS